VTEDTTKSPEFRPKRPKWIGERVRDQLQEAVDRGEFDNLPGQGKPLDLTRDDNPFVPEDLRLSYRILSNAGIGVPWIEDRKEIDRRRANLDREVKLHEARIDALTRNLGRMPAYLQPSRIEKLKAEHSSFVEFFSRSATSLNRRIDGYNLSVPSTQVQVNRVDQKGILDRLETLIAAVGQDKRNANAIDA
jgi:Domain of unknown function (DUF1992)